MTSAGWKWIEQGVDLLWPVSLELIFAATLMLAIALVIDLGLRRAAASVRHRVWALIMGGLLLLPLLCPVLPKVPVRLGIPITATSPLSLPRLRSSESTVVAPRQEESRSDVAAFTATSQADPLAPQASSANRQTASYTVETSACDGPSLLAGSFGMLIFVWMAGIVLCLVAMARSLWAERRLANSACRLDDPCWQTLLDEIRLHLGVCWAVAVGASQQTEVPLTIGWLTPTILVPVDCTHWTAAKRRVVLVHELSHVARHDVFWQIVARLACAVYWLHPLAWLADRRMRVERELACDDAVLRSGGRPDQYASVLLDVAAAVCRRSPTGAAAIAMACRNPIERRIRAILQPGLNRLPVGPRTGRLLLLGVLICVIVTAALHPFAPLQVNADPAKPQAVGAADEGHKKAKPDSVKPEKPGVRSARFRVLNQEGKPVTGAKVKLWGVIRPSLVRFIPPAVQTDDKGIATIEFISEPTSYVVVFVWADGYVTAGARWESDDAKESVPAEFTITLERGTTMGGIVQNEQGQPIVGAEVAISGQEDLPGGHCFYQADEKVRTDAQGKWTSHRIPKNLGRYVVPRIKLKHSDYATPPDFELSRQPLDELRAGTAVMVMHKGIAVEGIVTDSNGKPVAGAMVGQFADLFGGDFPRTRTDKKGHYRLPACEPGTFTIAAVARGFAPDSQQVVVDKQSPKVDLRLRKGERIRIRVVDPQGKPLQGATVSTAFDGKYRQALFVDNEDAFERGDRDLLTSVEGRWSRLWIPHEELDFYISKPGYSKVHKKLAPDEREEVITLEAGGWTFSGRVIDHDTKAPITKFYVVEGNGYGNVMWRNNKVVTNSKGEYREQWDTSGDSHRAVRIEADGYLPSEARSLAPDERAVTFDVELRKGEEIVGIVCGPDGKPVADAEVGLASATRLLLLRNSRPARDQRSLLVRTGADGRFAFAPQGEPYILVALHDLGFARIDGDAKHNELILQPWGKVEGTLLVDGRPAAKEHLRIVFDDEVIGRPPPLGMPIGGMPIDPGRYLYYEYQTQTDDKGHFAFDRVRPGTAKLCHHVKISQEGSMSSWKDADSQAIEVVPGRTLKVDLGAPDDK